MVFTWGFRWIVTFFLIADFKKSDSSKKFFKWTHSYQMKHQIEVKFTAEFWKRHRAKVGVFVDCPVFL